MACDDDNIRSVTSSAQVNSSANARRRDEMLDDVPSSFRVIRVNRSTFESGDRILDESRFVQRVRMQRRLSQRT